MKSINLKFENEKDFFSLSYAKSQAELKLNQNLTWEEFVILLKTNNESKK